MKVISKVALLGLGFAVSGCATVLNGTSQDFAIDSDPHGAQVVLSNGVKCETPCNISLKRRYDLRADFAKEGYEPAYVLVQSRMGGAIAGNLLLGGIIGGAVDASNGASNHLYPSPLNLRMVQAGSTTEAVLLNEKGEVETTVAAHNEKVRQDVARTIGAEAAGMPAPPISAVSTLTDMPITE